MEDKIIISLISFLGIVFSVTLSFIISKYQNKLEIIRIHSEFIGQLYSERLKAYLDIYNLISGFIKIIKRKRITKEELIVFYEEYSILDSKYGVLFSHTTLRSSQLIKKITDLISCKEKFELSGDQEIELIEKLGEVETSMKLELGIYIYRDPTRIIKNLNIPKIKKEILDNIDKKNETKRI